MTSDLIQKYMVRFYIAVFFLYLFGPLILMGVTAFNTPTFPTAIPIDELTMKWFSVLANDKDMIKGIKNSLWIGLGVVCLAVPIGLAAALLMSQVHKKAQSIYYMIVVSPLLTPGVILGISTLVFWDRLGVWVDADYNSVFYSGILPICANTNGVAAVMGHEVAHAFAKHGQERMSSAQMQQLGGLAVAIGTSGKDPRKAQMWNMIYGVGSQLGMLAFSRTHETEADRLGLVFMLMAGYQGEEAVNVWVRMSQRAGSGNAPPEFMSTHPSNQTRIRNLKAYLPTAKKYAAKFNQQGTATNQPKK